MAQPIRPLPNVAPPEVSFILRQNYVDTEISARQTSELQRAFESYFARVGSKIHMIKGTSHTTPYILIRVRDHVEGLTDQRWYIGGQIAMFQSLEEARNGYAPEFYDMGVLGTGDFLRSEENAKEQLLNSQLSVHQLLKTFCDDMTGISPLKVTQVGWTGSRLEVWLDASVLCAGIPFSESMHMALMPKAYMWCCCHYFSDSEEHRHRHETMAILSEEGFQWRHVW